MHAGGDITALEAVEKRQSALCCGDVVHHFTCNIMSTRFLVSSCNAIFHQKGHVAVLYLHKHILNRLVQHL